ncbi:ABC transporter substrate-binding protein [Pendulispora rubella]|uniref:ABC transporter substrate-binding protein n=1 Tax=Pendulispora rubella TaxID=2741070 RepID=A0ABZ2LCM0_9BACT
MIGRRRLGTSVFVLALATVGFNCSIVVDSETAQCDTTADCTKRGPAFANATCNTSSHYCVTSGGQVGGDCKKNQDCLDAHPGEPWTCRKSDLTCAKLTSAECPAYLADPADLANDNAIILGTILDRTGTAGPIGQAMEVAFNFARQDFRDAVSGLPPLTSGGGRRPLVLVNCDENAAAPANSDPVKAANHLVNDLKVPAILGGFYSSTTIKVAQNVTIPQHVLLVTPASTSPLVTSLPSADPRLVWRMVPSDIIQGQVVPAVTRNMEATLKTEVGLQSTDKIKVAIVHRGDAAGSAIAQVVIDNLEFNGARATAEGNRNYFKEYNYGDPLADPGGSEAKYTQFATEMYSTFQPHIVITAGSTAEVVTKIMKPIENPDNWKQPGCGPTANKCYRPRYLLANSNFQAQSLLDLVGSNADLRHRVLGHVAQTEGTNLEKLKLRYNGAGASVPFVPLVPFAYDAVYFTAFGIAAASESPLTGSAIAKAFPKILPPNNVSIDVGLNKIPDALNTLAGGGGIDFNGASGLLDFDTKTGDAPCDIQVWCINSNSSGFNNSGYYYNAKAGSMQGAIDTGKCP